LDVLPKLVKIADWQPISYFSGNTKAAFVLAAVVA